MISSIKIFSFFRFLLVYILPLVMINSYQIEKEKRVFRYAVSEQVLFGININDAKLALGKIIEKYAENEKIEYQVDVKIYNDVDKLADEHNKLGFDVISLLSSEYFYLRKKIDIKPFLTTARSETIFSRYLLIVNSNSEINSVDKIQGKQIEFYSNSNLDFSITLKLLDQLCLDRFNKPAADVFLQMKTVENPHNSLLGVFFGDIDICLIEDFQYDVITELNPQLKKNLKILYYSDKVITGLTCKTDEIQDEELFRDKAVNMHKTSYGKQLLDIFKVSKAYSITNDDLRSVEVLFNKN